MAEQFVINLKQLERAIQRYVAVDFPLMAGKKGLRFIDDNFRKQAWPGLPAIKWKGRKGNTDPGRAILVGKGSGFLRRSFRMATAIGQARVYTSDPKAKVHNEGFRGMVQIPTHMRKKMVRAMASSVGLTKKGQHKKAKLIKTYGGDMEVKAHSRKMNIPRRQFMPTELRQSTVLNADVKRQVTLDVMKILKGKKL